MRKVTPVLLGLFLMLGLCAVAQAQDEEGTATGTFAIGRGGAAAKAAVDVQHQLRMLATTTGTLKLVDMQALLDPDDEPPRKAAVVEAMALLEQGKQAYENLELEDAQEKFQQALKKFEYGYGYLERSGYLLETLMYQGASYVLIGEPKKGRPFFVRAADLPGRKMMNDELFPPNIQEIFDQVKAEAKAGKRAKASLITLPQGATVYVDNVYRGGSPLQIEDLRPGEHLVRATKDGFRPWGGKIQVNAGRLKRLKLTLKPAARRKEFSDVFRKLAAETLKGAPGPGAAEFSRFLGAQRLVIVVLDGEPAAMNMRGLMCEIDEQIRHSEIKEIIDTTSPAYEEQLKAFLIKLLQTNPKDEFADGDAADGAAAAAALIAANDKDPKNDGSPELGLDLGDDGTKDGDPAAGDAGKDDPKLAQADTSDVKSEQDREKEAADKVVKDAGKTEPDDSDQSAAFSWTYLHDKWWFWSAIGVVAAGAATGTYFAVSGSSSDPSGGELILGIH